MCIRDSTCTNGKYDENFISNYLEINVFPRLKRIEGVGDCLLYTSADSRKHAHKTFAATIRLCRKHETEALFVEISLSLIHIFLVSTLQVIAIYLKV